MSEHEASPEFERELQNVASRSAGMYVPRSDSNYPLAGFRVTVIPDEAVEAAAKRAYLDSAKGRRTCEAWESLDDSERSSYSLDAARILEAAGPYLMAQGWDEAVNVLYLGEAINQDHMKAMWARNPYRKPTDAD